MKTTPVNGSSSTDALYHQAIQRQLAGHTEEAQQLYQQLLQMAPQHAEANHNLGLLLYSRDDVENALPLLMNAVEQQPQQQQFWISLCEVLLAAGAAGHVIEALHQAHAAGVPVCDEFLQMERRAAALLGPNQVGDLTRAENTLPLDVAVATIIAGRRQMSSLKEILHVHQGKNISKVEEQRIADLFNSGQAQAMLREGEQLIRKYPGAIAGWMGVGLAKVMLNDRQGAVQYLLKANELSPDNVRTLYFLGYALQYIGETELARQCYERSLELQPDYLNVLSNLAMLYTQKGNHVRAETLLDHLLKLDPNRSDAYHILATIHMVRGNISAATEAYEKSLALKPSTSILGDYGLFLYNTGQLQRGIEFSRRAVTEYGNDPLVYSNLLFFMSHDETVSPQALYEAHLEFARQFEQPLLNQRQAHSNSREPERKLRIGFVSGDLHYHAVVQFIEPILQKLDRSQFDLYAFYTRAVNDAATVRLKSLFRLWMDVPAVSPRDLVELIRATKIDILVDLSGHTGYNRLLTFAHKPAPVQMTWVGYPYTTGLQSMDYFLTDFYTTPEGDFDQLYTEKLVRLPSNYEFLELKTDIPINELPALQNGYLTFASFNRHSKISETTLDIWAQVLQAVPDARMLIAATPGDEAEKKIRNALMQWGIAAERLRFSRVVDYETYLKMHHEVDLLLDTYPYNGGTTTNHALNMGVPMLALSSRDMVVSNLGAGISVSFGLQDFVARDQEHLQEKARYWANHLQELAVVRAGLRQQIHKRIGQLHTAKGIEAALRHMWRQWCQGLPAEAFRLDVEDF